MTTLGSAQWRSSTLTLSSRPAPGGVDERRPAHGVAVIGVGTAGEQQLEHAGAAGAPARFDERIRSLSVGRLHLRPRLDEQPDYIDVSFGSGEHERGLLRLGPALDIDAILDQALKGRNLA